MLLVESGSLQIQQVDGRSWRERFAQRVSKSWSLINRSERRLMKYAAADPRRSQMLLIRSTELTIGEPKGMNVAQAPGGHALSFCHRDGQGRKGRA